MDDLDLIRTLPASERESDESRAAARAQLSHYIASRGRRRSMPRLRMRMLVPAGAVAAAAMLAIITGIDSADVTPDRALADVLERAASAAEQDPDAPALGPGEYWYLKSRDAYIGTYGDPPPYSVIEPSERELWIDRTGHGRIRSIQRKKPRFVGPRDRENWKAHGSPKISTDSRTFDETGRIGYAWFDYDEVRGLPTDPRELYEHLRDTAGDSGPSPDVETFVIIGDTLRADPVPGRIRAAMYRAAAYIDGIRLVGAVKDPIGRDGISIAIDHAGIRRSLILDPETYELLAEEQVVLERNEFADAAPGTVIGSATYLKSGIVRSMRDRVN